MGGRQLARRLRAHLTAPLRRRYARLSMVRPYEIVVVESSRLLAGKVAVVTGAGGAIGRAIAVRLATEGATVHLLGRNLAKLEEVAKEIRFFHGVASTAQVDVTHPEEFATYIRDLGSVDILVNNAGGSSRERNAPIWQQSTDVIDELLNLNLRAAMLCTGAVSDLMVRNGGGGKIILIGSTVAVGGKANFSDYAAAKSGLTGFVRSAALELGPHNVTINCVSPGIIPRGSLREDELSKIIGKGVLPREGKAEDVAELVAFLASSRADFVTGQNLIVDGGRSLGLFGDS